MAQILPFVRRRNVFDPDATLAMGDAYDKAIATIETDARSAELKTWRAGSGGSNSSFHRIPPQR